MTSVKITKRMVDSSQASTCDYWIWDSDVKGFALKVTPAGSKIYAVQYRTGGRETTPRRFTIGKHGSPWTCETARQKAVEILAQVSQGEDPAERKVQARDDLTVDALCDIYFAQPIIITKRGTPKRASSLKTDRSNIDRHVRPLIGGRRIGTLTRADIEKLQIDIASGKTAADEKTKKQGRAIVKGGPGTAARTIAIFSAILAYGVSIGLRKDNPGRGVRLLKGNDMERFLSEAEQMKLGDALEVAERNGTNPSAVAALRLLALTGCRKSEILTLRWNFIDFDRGLIRFPDTKTGPKTLPVAQPVLDYIRSLPRMKNNPFVLPGDKEGMHYIGLQKIWEALREPIGLADVRIHDLRHSFASVGSNEGDSLQIIGRLLGHSKAATTQRYAHLSIDPIKDAVERISGRIAAKLIPEVGSAPKVTRIPLMLPVKLLNQALKLAEREGQTLDAFVAAGLVAHIERMGTDPERSEELAAV